MNSILSKCENKGRNQKSDKSQDYAQKPQRNCILKNSISGLFTSECLFMIPSSGISYLRKLISLFATEFKIITSLRLCTLCAKFYFFARQSLQFSNLHKISIYVFAQKSRKTKGYKGYNNGYVHWTYPLLYCPQARTSSAVMFNDFVFFNYSKKQ